MKRLIMLLALLLFFACKKEDKAGLKLLRKEVITYTGALQITEYVYDFQDRIIAIKQAENNAPLTTVVTISYNGDEALLISQPKYDPAYNINKEVRLTLDARGKLLKKLGYSNFAAFSSPSTRFLYDTLTCEYDVAGFLKETKKSFYDSIWQASGNTSIGRANYKGRFTTVAGNLTKLDRLTEYSRINVNAGATTISGGINESQTTFSYTKMYPNKTDFKNAAVLNETLDFYGILDYDDWAGYFEPLRDSKYANMSEKATTQSIERDLSGSITNNYSSTIEVTRTYNSDGFLSTVEMLNPGTPYSKIRYIYGR